MATTPTPFAAATAGDAGGPTAANEAGSPMSLSSKMMTILVLMAVLCIVLIAIFVTNLMGNGSDDKATDDTSGDDTTDVDPNSSTDTSGTSHSSTKDYIGVVVSSVMLVLLVPSFYYVNSI